MKSFSRDLIQNEPFVLPKGLFFSKRNSNWESRARTDNHEFHIEEKID